MTAQTDNLELLLAAEEIESSIFESSHKFSDSDESIISRLIAHGPVLLRGGRGSGKSALMIEASRRIASDIDGSQAVGVYLSLRYLPLLRSSGAEYESIFLKVLLEKLKEQFPLYSVEIDSAERGVTGIKSLLSFITQSEGKRLVFLFDDAAHIGREASLQEFFDLFRTLSSPSVSCKAAIYPGVTRFGVRFDIYNDATTIDLFRNEATRGYDELFHSVLLARFPDMFQHAAFSSGLDQYKVSGFLARTVLGNMRAFIFACSKLREVIQGGTVDLPALNGILRYLSEDYYWPLLDELRPKLGVYEPMLDPAQEIAGFLFQKAADQREATSVLILRDLVSRHAKSIELLEYAGFISRREASKAMKSGGRGTRYQLTICNVLEKVKGARLTSDLFSSWSSRDVSDPVEFHRGSELANVPVPEMKPDADLGVLSLDIEVLKTGPVYPYGLTDQKLIFLLAAGIQTIGQLAEMSDTDLLRIPSVGIVTKDRIKNVVAQAIWM